MNITPDMLSTNFIGKRIYHYKKVHSTNKLAKELAQEGAGEGTVVIADSQTKGKGRLGKSWESPDKTGIWMSVILKPNIIPSKAANITLVTGVAICKAISEITNLEVSIKWPNDIVVNGKKVCGVLTEMSGKIDETDYVIVGIGINVSMDEFPKYLEKRATSLKIESGSKYDRESIIISLLENLEKHYKRYLEKGMSQSILKQYKELCITLRSSVKVTNKKEAFIATPIDIDPSGGLIIQKEDGSYKTVTSGEVSVRGIYGYV